MSHDDALPSWREGLGRLGVWVFGGAIDDNPGALARFVEDLGFGGLWIGGGNPDAAAFDRLEQLLASTSRLVVATGIVNLWAWDPGALALRAQRLEQDHPGRFVLGIGVSHEHLVEQLGRRYERPYRHMVAFLDELDAPGATPGVGQPPRVLAALGAKMLKLSAERAQGAHPYLTTPAHTREAREVLGPAPLLAPEQAVILDEDVASARARARAYLAAYLRLPNYARNLARLGFDAEDLAGSGSDALVDALVAHGDTASVAAAITAHLDAGADHVCVQPIADGRGVDRRALELLAPALGLPAA
jgi:probable F420-dependent oxidoreductase